MQIDLQRKHAELQEIIGQQQAELKRVSEQLLMARLGVLPPSSDNPPTSTDVWIAFYPTININVFASSSRFHCRHIKMSVVQPPKCKDQAQPYHRHRLFHPCLYLK